MLYKHYFYINYAYIKVPLYYIYIEFKYLLLRKVNVYLTYYIKKIAICR